MRRPAIFACVILVVVSTILFQDGQPFLGAIGHLGGKMANRFLGAFDHLECDEAIRCKMDTASAQLRAEKPLIDLGELRGGPRLAQTFVLCNDGPDTIEILELRPSCGCALARVDVRSLKPGEKATVTLDVNTLGQAAGLQAWKTTVQARRHGKVEEMALEVRAHLISEVTVQPAALTLFTEGTRSHEIVLTDCRDQPLTITTVHSSLPHVPAELIEQQGGVARIRVHAAADLPPGRHEAIVSLFSDDPEYRHLQVPVRIIKQPRSALSFGPRQIEFTTSSGHPFPAKLVRIWSGQDAPVQIGRVYADDPALICTWAAGPGNQATLRIRIDRARQVAARVQSAVHVEVRQPVAETITIPVTIELK